MCIRHFVMILAVSGLLGLAGCAALDQAAKDLGTAGRAARKEARDPAAPLTPDMRTVLEGLGLGAVGLANLYQHLRYGRLKKTTRAIVRGVQDAEPQKASRVKEKIRGRMLESGQFERLNAVVDKLKVS